MSFGFCSAAASATAPAHAAMSRMLRRERQHCFLGAGRACCHGRPRHTVFGMGPQPEEAAGALPALSNLEARAPRGQTGAVGVKEDKGTE